VNAFFILYRMHISIRSNTWVSFVIVNYVPCYIGALARFPLSLCQQEEEETEMLLSRIDKKRGF
jgi:hypothetical protein